MAKDKKNYSIDYTDRDGRQWTMNNVDAETVEKAEKKLKSWYVKDGIQEIKSIKERK